MSQIMTPPHTPWIDRFNTPTATCLLEQYESSAESLANTAFKELSAIMDSDPSVEWKGLSWRWTCVFRVPGEPEPVAYLVPTPDWPSIAVPVPADMAAELLSKRGSKYLKETLMHACQVGEIRWAQWQIQGKAQLADVLGLTAAITIAQRA